MKNLIFLALTLIAVSAEAHIITRKTEVNCRSGSDSVIIRWDSAEAGFLPLELLVNGTDVLGGTRMIMGGEGTTYSKEGIFSIEVVDREAKRGRFRQNVEVYGRQVQMECRAWSRLVFFSN